MKLLYLILFVFILMITGYMFINDFNFDNTTFSNYLIIILVTLFISCVVVGAVAWMLTLKRKNHYKGIMTIRQYYDYKSVR